jgi:hypothetical protein
MIEVERTRNTRVVTICSTGKQTASESHRRAA